MAYISSTSSGSSALLTDDDPILDGIEARFAMSEAGLSQIMRLSSTGAASTGHDIMNFLASMTAHREENPHVDAPPPQVDPYADARTAAAVSAGIGAAMSATAGIAAGASGSSGAMPSGPSSAAVPAAEAPPPPPAETGAATSTSTSTSTSASTASETPPPPAESAPPPPPAETASAPVETAPARPRRPWAERDADHDGVPNGTDACRGTARGMAVDARGCVAAPVASADPVVVGAGYTSEDGSEHAEPISPMSHGTGSVVPGVVASSSDAPEPSTVLVGDIPMLVPEGATELAPSEAIDWSSVTR